MNNFKNLSEFQEQMDEFYEENESERQTKEIPILQEQTNERGVTFEIIQKFCNKCNAMTEIEVYTVRHKQEEVCSRCKTKTEKRI